MINIHSILTPTISNEGAQLGWTYFVAILCNVALVDVEHTGGNFQYPGTSTTFSGLDDGPNFAKQLL